MAFLRGFGHYVPPRVVTNEQLAAWAGKPADWIRNASGIEERRWADENVTVADLGAAAARDCLERAGVAVADLGMIVVASGSAERRFPGPAVAVAHSLGLEATPAIDLPMASAGSLFGLAMASRLAAVYGNILVVGAEKMSAVVNRQPFDANTGILFGDGAGACLVSASRGSHRIVDSLLMSDGSGAASLFLDADTGLTMEGMAVIVNASRRVPAAIASLLERNGRAAADIGVFLMHQANVNLIARIAKALGVAPERFFTNIARYGNTSSASMLIAASEAGLDVSHLCFAAFGAGWHWGALLAEKT